MEVCGSDHVFLNTFPPLVSWPLEPYPQIRNFKVQIRGSFSPSRKHYWPEKDCTGVLVPPVTAPIPVDDPAPTFACPPLGPPPKPGCWARKGLGKRFIRSIEFTACSPCPGIRVFPA